MMRNMWLMTLLSMNFLSLSLFAELKYEISDWHDPGKGNIRAIVQVDNPADAVHVNIPWRRDDIAFDQKGIVVYDMQTGKQVRNACIIKSDRISGDIVFEPVSGAGRYAIYYMPYIRPEKLLTFWRGDYIRPLNISEPQWLVRNALPSASKLSEKMLNEYGAPAKVEGDTIVISKTNSQFSLAGVFRDFENNDYTLSYDVNFASPVGSVSSVLLPQRFDEPPSGYECKLTWSNRQLFAQIDGLYIIPTKIYNSKRQIGQSKKEKLDIDISKPVEVTCRAKVYENRTMIVMTCKYTSSKTGEPKTLKLQVHDTNKLRCTWGRAPVFLTRGVDAKISNVSVKNAAAEEVFAVMSKPPKAIDLTKLAKAKVVSMQARKKDNKFFPMRVIASQKEVDEMLAAVDSNEILLFAEPGSNPIKMINYLPEKWAKHGPYKSLQDTAQPGGYYTFQIGLYSPSKNIEIEDVKFEDMKSSDGKVIPAESITCFNIEGRDHLNGTKFRKKVPLSKGKVRPLWLGIDIPKDAAGKYSTEFTVITADGKSRPVTVEIDVTGKPVENGGDANQDRLSRLRWLNSTVGMDSKDVPYPYIPVKVNTDETSILKREITFGKNGFPSSIKSFGHEVLAAPVELQVIEQCKKENFRIVKTENSSNTPSYSKRTAVLESDNCKVAVVSNTDFTGIITYSVKLTALKDLDIENIKLQIPMDLDTARYMIGFTRRPDDIPDKFTWKWNPKKSHNVGWFGRISAGLGFRLLPQNIHTWEMRQFTDFAGYRDWYNSDKGGVAFQKAADSFNIDAYTGPMKIATGQQVDLNFRLFVTPFKPINPKHWNDHVNWFSRAGKGNIRHLHHGGYIEPFINYPFAHMDRLKHVIQSYTPTSKNRGSNLYYTCREISAHAPEIFAFRSLGDEILLTTGAYLYAVNIESYQGSGGGAIWLQENLKAGYSPCWVNSVCDSDDVDYAIGINPNSRMLNFYVAGLDYLKKRLGNFGLYLDGIGYGGETTRRLARILAKDNPTYRISYHTGNLGNYSGGRCLDTDRFCPIARNMEHLPFVTNLMYGEMFEFSEGPKYWLLELSGLQFGLTNDFYCHYENMNSAYKPLLYDSFDILNPNIQALWDFLDEWKMDQAKIIGYWNEKCPVMTSNKNVLASVYKKKNGQTMIVLASWEKKPVKVKLLMSSKKRCKLDVPEIKGLQKKQTIWSDQEIEVQPNQGIILLFKNIKTSDI